MDAGRDAGRPTGRGSRNPTTGEGVEWTKCRGAVTQGGGRREPARTGRMRGMSVEWQRGEARRRTSV